MNYFTFRDLSAYADNQFIKIEEQFNKRCFTVVDTNLVENG